jgi:hypothetical protein
LLDDDQVRTATFVHLSHLAALHPEGITSSDINRLRSARDRHRAVTVAR